MSPVINMILIGIPVLSILVFVHELGHFLAAKMCGVGVIKFSIGFGPRLLSFRYRETLYQFALIPLGGFVRMLGDLPEGISGKSITDELVAAKSRGENIEEALEQQSELIKRDYGVKELTPALKSAILDKSRWYTEKNSLQKAWIIFAGPFFNLVFAFLLFVFSAYFLNEVPAEESIIGGVIENSVAAVAGIKEGDLVQKINGEEIKYWMDLPTKIAESAGAKLSFEIKRGTEILNLDLLPEKKVIQSQGKEREIYMIGIKPAFKKESTDVISAVKIAFDRTWTLVAMTLAGLKMLVSGDGSVNDLRGPITILDHTAQIAEASSGRLIDWMCFLNISLAVLNLLPIPVLDGGHLLFIFLESIFGAISFRIKLIAQQVGLIFLLGLMFIALKNDFFGAPLPRVNSAEPKWEKIPKAP